MSQILRYKTGSTVPNVLTTDKIDQWTEAHAIGPDDVVDRAER